ncbi:MAG: type II and III secretion system protein family protein [Pseudomonadota bacterium]|jgi:pilus assembly protein CpaC
MEFRLAIADAARRLRRAGLPLAAAAFVAASPAVAGEELAPEPAPHLELRTPVDAAVPLRTLGAVEMVVVSQPEIAKVAAVGPEDVYVQGRELGATNLLVFGRDGQLSQTVSVRVGHDAEGLREALAAALPEARIEVTALSVGLMISGEVADAATAQIAEQLAERAAPGAVISRLTARASQVRLDVRIVEASSRRLRDLGASLSVTDGSHLAASLGRGLVGPEAPQTSGAVQIDAGRYAVDAALQALESKGDARVVARPTLIALSGAKASFRSGGELPYPVPQDDGQVTVEFRPYGAALSFTPEVQANGLIRITLDAELSAVDNSAGVTIADVDIPALSTRRAATAVELRAGEPFVIAGLFEDSTEQSAQQTPGLSRIPLLGGLLRSVRTEETRRELAIIVTPSFASPEPPGPPVPAEAAAERAPTVLVQADPPRPSPEAGAGPRGPPLMALVRDLRDAVRPPLRWAKRKVTALVSALVGPRRTQYASARRT